MPEPDSTFHQLTLTTLTNRCAEERTKYRARTEADPRYCFEIFRRALNMGLQDAWESLHACFMLDVRGWVKKHPVAGMVIGYGNGQESEEYLAQASFTRLFEANQRHPLQLNSLGEAMGFWRRCVNSIMLDHARAMRETVSIDLVAEIPAQSDLDDLLDEISAGELWQIVEQCVVSPRELRVAHLLWVEGYRPRELPDLLPDEFNDVEEVRRISANIIERLRRRYRRDEIRQA